MQHIVLPGLYSPLSLINRVLQSHAPRKTKRTTNSKSEEETSSFVVELGGKQLVTVGQAAEQIDNEQVDLDYVTQKIKFAQAVLVRTA